MTCSHGLFRSNSIDERRTTRAAFIWYLERSERAAAAFEREAEAAIVGRFEASRSVDVATLR